MDICRKHLAKWMATAGYIRVGDSYTIVEKGAACGECVAEREAAAAASR